MTLFALAAYPLGGAGFALLVAASPLGQLPYKPFACRTCLSGWGGALTWAVLQAAQANPMLPWWQMGAHVILAMLLATGGAHLILRTSTPPAATTLVLPPAFDADGDGISDA